jgi:hypothetical protein
MAAEAEGSPLGEFLASLHRDIESDLGGGVVVG